MVPEPGLSQVLAESQYAQPLPDESGDYSLIYIRYRQYYFQQISAKNNFSLLWE